jgi:hypothetical protein
MAMDKDRLRDSILANLKAICSFTHGCMGAWADDNFCGAYHIAEALADAIIDEITTYAEVASGGIHGSGSGGHSHTAGSID